MDIERGIGGHIERGGRSHLRGEVGHIESGRYLDIQEGRYLLWTYLDIERGGRSHSRCPGRSHSRGGRSPSLRGEVGGH